MLPLSRIKKESKILFEDEQSLSNELFYYHCIHDSW